MPESPKIQQRFIFRQVDKVAYWFSAKSRGIALPASTLGFRRKPKEAHKHTQSLGLESNVSFSVLHLAERKILKLRTGMRPGITECNKKRMDKDVGRVRRGNKRRHAMNTPLEALSPALSHYVILAVFLIFSDKA